MKTFFLIIIIVRNHKNGVQHELNSIDDYRLSKESILSSRSLILDSRLEIVSS